MKKWYQSKSIWVQIVGFLASMAAAFGFDLGLPPEQQMAIATALWSIAGVVVRFKTSSEIAPVGGPTIKEVPGDGVG